MTATVLQGDCRELMAAIAEASVDSIVTDPPYELGFMGRSWDSTGIAYDVAMWREALRVLKPGGFLLAFGGSRTYHRMACAIEDAGFEIRDQIMWLYGSGFPKGGLDEEGRGTCLKPAHEPIVVARKPFNGSVDANVTRFGTGRLNIDACRIGSSKDVPTSPAKASVGQRSHGNERAKTLNTPGCDPHVGRWPANVIHDGSDEVVAGFPESDARDGARKGDNMGFSRQGSAVNREPVAVRRDAGSAARYFYCAKASKADRDEGLGHLDPQAFVQFQTGNGESGQASSLSAGRDTQYRNTHPTVKPEGLMRYLERLVTPPGGTILDPFCGSGSTGKAAVLEGYRFIGCEITEAYIPIARARIAAAEARVEVERTGKPQGSLFEDAA